MPIHLQIKEDIIKLFETMQWDFLVHGCNCMNTMGKGIAKTLKQKYPEVYDADSKTIYGDATKLGGYSYHTLPDERTIINAYTQYDYRGKMPCDYLAIQSVFHLLNLRYRGSRFIIPKIGAGLAGGDWNRIQNIINEQTPDLDITLSVYDG